MLTAHPPCWELLPSPVKLGGETSEKEERREGSHHYAGTMPRAQ